MSSNLRVGLFCVLVVPSLLGGGWLIYEGVNSWTFGLALLDPDRAITVDASIVDRRLQGGDHDVKFSFQPTEPQTAIITSRWVTVSKAIYDSLPKSNATLPVTYVKGTPEWYSLKTKLEENSYRRDCELGVGFAVGMGVTLPVVAAVWFYWLCFASAQPLTISCQLGCLNDSKYDSSGTVLRMVMNYQTVPRTYALDTSQHFEEIRCSFCSKPIKVRVASRQEARQLAAGFCSLIAVSGVIISLLASSFWATCPAWFPAVSVVSGIAIGSFTFWHMWNWPAFHSAVTLVEGKGNVVHSKTMDNGSVVHWHEHELLK